MKTINLDRHINALKTIIADSTNSDNRVKDFAVNIVAKTYSCDEWGSEKKALMSMLIIPALSQAQQTAIARDITKNGTKAHDALTASEQAELVRARADKVAAHKIAHQWHRRLGIYAFPPEKAEKKEPAAVPSDGAAGEKTSGAGKTLKTRIALQVTDLIKRCQAEESADFDITAAVAALNAVMAAIAKPIGK